MHLWKFIAVPSPSRAGFGWRWREERNGAVTRESRDIFDLYYDCVEDARAHGYSGENPRPEEGGAVGKPEAGKKN
jgi:hypothetical protein